MDAKMVSKFCDFTIELPQELPPELTEEVLLRTSIPGVKRFRLVSKTWFCRLSELGFSLLYRARNEPTKSTLFVASQDGLHNSKTLFSLPNSLSPPTPSLVRKFPLIASDMQLIGSWLGIVCLCDSHAKSGEKNCLLLNPSTGDKKMIQLPPVKEGVVEGFVSMGLAFTGINFRVVRLSPILSFPTSSIIESYYVEDNLWKNLGQPIFHPEKHYCSFILRGVPYWEVDKSQLGDPVASVLLWCDGEHYGEVPYPVIEAVESIVAIVTIDEQIVALSLNRQRRRMQSYFLEPNGAWSKRFVLGPFDSFSQQVKDAKSVGSLVLCLRHGRNGLYNTDMNCALPLPAIENFSPVWSDSCAYEETLVGFAREEAVLSQLKEMGGRSRPADTMKVSDQPTEKKKGLGDWMNMMKPVNEEKDHRVSDEAVTQCTACGSDFSAFVRRHHCRNCGDIFCDKCTHGRIALTADENAPQVRVCDRCMAEVTHILSNAKEAAYRPAALESHEGLAKKLQEEMERNRKSSSGSKSDGSGKRMKEVACPTCTVHLQVQVPSSGSETIECGVCQHPFLVSAR